MFGAALEYSSLMGITINCEVFKINLCKYFIDDYPGYDENIILPVHDEYKENKMWCAYNPILILNEVPFPLRRSILPFI